MLRVTVCDLGIGNLRSVVRAVSLGGAQVDIASAPDGLTHADVVIVPGQGAFRDGAAALARGFGDALRSHIASGRPYLGICLGLQLLFDTSDESPGARGLGIMAGHVARIPTGAAPGERSPLKLPHIGWNEVEPPPAENAAGIALRPLFGKQVYFAHSYAATPADPGCVAAMVDYGGPLVCAVAKENVLAVQFHPEKSQKVGLGFLDEWLRAIEAGGRS